MKEAKKTRTSTQHHLEISQTPHRKLLTCHRICARFYAAKIS